MVDGWQPIETAPRGREILVAATDDSEEAPSVWLVEITDDGRWCIDSQTYDFYPTWQRELLFLRPVAWMPLPEPPDEKA